MGTKSSYSIIASDELDEYNYDDDDFEDYYESDFEEDIGDEESLEKLCLSLPKSLSLNNNVVSVLYYKLCKKKCKFYKTFSNKTKRFILLKINNRVRY